MSEQSGTHPTWCVGDHGPDGGHSSRAVTVEPEGPGLTRAVLNLWQPPHGPVMVAVELSSDGDEEAMLYLFSLADRRELWKALQCLGQLIEEAGRCVAAGQDLDEREVLQTLAT